MRIHRKSFYSFSWKLGSLAAVLALSFSMHTPFSDAKELPPSNASAHFNAPILAATHAQVFDAFRQQNFSGTVIVATDEQVLFRAAAGSKDFTTGIPNSPEDKFLIASITKQFAAAAILQLEEKGKLSVHDPVSRHLPDFPHGEKMTVHQLLNHTAGLLEYTVLPEFAELVKGPAENIQKVMSLFAGKPLEFTPGTKFKYSNSGYVLLGAIIERVSGQSFESYVRDFLLQPQGMLHSGYAPDTRNIGIVTGHDLDRDYQPKVFNFSHMSWVHAAGGLYATVDDLMRWNAGLYNGKVISLESLSRMTTPGLQNYGYGLSMTKRWGVSVISHTGGIPGFNSMNVRIPEKNLSIIVLSNFFDQQLGELITKLAEVSVNGQAELSTPPVEIPMAPEALFPFAGKYRVSPQLLFTLTQEGNKIYLQGTNQPQFRLIPLAEGQFILKVNGVKLEFVRAEDGSISAMRIFQNGQVTEAKREP
jgi:CubicO group peptidase (beta-lactamase class C family)